MGFFRILWDDPNDPDGNVRLRSQLGEIMAKKLERVFRDRRLTPEEVARDEALRRQVQQEFPPSKRSFVPGSFSETLKQTVHSSGKSLTQISKETGVSEVLLARYLAGECDIHIRTADKLAEGLGLKLTVIGN